MNAEQIASVVTSLAALLGCAHLLAYVFERLKQPRLVGEILAGVVFGPFVLGWVSPSLSQAIVGGAGDAGGATGLTLGFVFWLGLLLLMFISGSEVRRVLGRENRRPTAWILGIGKTVPFAIALLVGWFLPLERLSGEAGHRIALLLVLAIAVAVTSIPVISRIFHDLGILHTRFASLVLGAALLEDIVLWAVLAIARALSGPLTQGAGVTGAVSVHVAATVAYLAAGLFVAPPLLRRLHTAPWNVIRNSSPAGYAVLVLLGYAALAAAFGVDLVFAAFLAGFGLVGGMGGTLRSHFAEQIDAIKKVAFGVFIPIYFAMVGAKLNFGQEFSLSLLLLFLIGSSALSLGSVALAARLAGFQTLEIVNLAVASNARGGPGIVLASVAYEARIINGAFFTTLVLTAILTSQVAGAWLGVVLRRGWTLLRDDMGDLAPRAAPRPQAVAASRELFTTTAADDARKG